MILGYRDKQTKRFGQGEFVRAFQGFEQQAERGLASNGASAFAGQMGSPGRAMLRSWTIIKGKEPIMFKRAVHPGEILKDELDGLGVTPTELARQIEVPANRVGQIISGKRAITGDTALRLGHWFGTEPQFWLNLQVQFDLAVAARETGNAIRHLPTKAALPPPGAVPRLG